MNVQGDPQRRRDFTVNTYVSPVARGMRAFFVIRGTVRKIDCVFACAGCLHLAVSLVTSGRRPFVRVQVQWTFRNSLELAVNTDAREHDMDMSAFKGVLSRK